VTDTDCQAKRKRSFIDGDNREKKRVLLLFGFGYTNEYIFTFTFKEAEAMNMTEQQFQDSLQEVLERVCPDLTEEDWAVDHVATYQQAAVMTENKGLVVQLNNGQRFQLTIVEA
jgi:hypothetical protein